MTHICIGNLAIIGSDNGLSPGWCQAIIWTNTLWNLVNWTLRNKLKWNFNQNSYIFVQENAFEDVCEFFLSLSVLKAVQMAQGSKWPRPVNFKAIFMIYLFQEQEARTELLRSKARKRAIGSSDAVATISTTSGHVNFFAELEEGVGVLWVGLEAKINSLWPSDNIWWHR